MKASLLRSIPFVIAASLAGLPTHGVGKELASMELLYIGAGRSAEFAGFLKDHVAKITTASLNEFTPDDAKYFDVILLGWPQHSETDCPLGTRDTWEKPTVLLGSAGLNLAIAWQIEGGSGCTCLEPLAYDLRQHEVFAGPLAIDRSTMRQIPTPQYFRNDIADARIDVLPLVNDLQRRDAALGWCTHTVHINLNPDVEVFSGGVNHQTPTSAALWRQGNLLHFGFQESPAEMNDQGKRLLLNSIAYISRFTRDRPIAITPSVFAKRPVPAFRTTPYRYLSESKYPTNSIKNVLSRRLWDQITSLPDREQMAARAKELAPFLCPDSDQRLEIDEDLQTWGIPFDDSQFFAKALAELRSNDQRQVSRADRLLKRYAPDGPSRPDAEDWSVWWAENRPYLFAADHANYRWYIDPLAKRRGVHQSELRGPRRADEFVGTDRR